MVSLDVKSQEYLKSNEQEVISFNTVTGKKLIFAIDSHKKYVVYRFGSVNHIDLEYPKNLNGSFKKFKWYYYIRNGGVRNEATEQFQLQFINDGFTYKLYENWDAAKTGTLHSLGVIVTNNKTNKLVNIIGNPKTERGSLRKLRDIEEIELSEDEL
jgi:hypothetical protein